MLTETRKEIIKFIKYFIYRHGFSPSVMDISKELDVYPNGIHGHIKILERDGYITKSAGVARSIRLTEKGESL